jgi:hypothetical protein
LDRADEPLGTAPELVVKPKPPEQDFDFTISRHQAEIVQSVNNLASR